MDLPQHVLRFWETRFPQIKPLKRGGGRRYYRPEDVELLRAIKRLLYGEGYTIKGVQKLLKEQGANALTRSVAAPPRLPAPAPAKPAPPEPPKARAEPPMRRPEAVAAPAPPPAPIASPRPALTNADLGELRAALAELREAERILARARSA